MSIELELRREQRAYSFDKEWKEKHIPIIDRLKKVDGKYIIEDCEHCANFMETEMNIITSINKDIAIWNTALDAAIAKLQEFKVGPYYFLSTELGKLKK